jgi:uncharacterized protein RhaS with RHS repeats
MKSMNRYLSAAFAVITIFAANSVHAYYNPQTGRWLSADPVAEPGFRMLQGAYGGSVVGAAVSHGRFLNRDIGDRRDELNLYAFVGNDSANYFDALGLECCLVTYHRSDGQKLVIRS